MANDTTKVTLPREAVTTVINKVKDTSTIAALSPSEPQKFDDKTYLVFNPTSEAEVVAEGAKKGSYDISTSPIVAKRAKIVTTTRVSDELRWADEDNQLEIVTNIIADQAAAFEAEGQSPGEALAAASGYALEDTPYASGYAGYKDWFILEYDRPGYTVECGEGENPLPYSDIDSIYPDVRALLAQAVLGC